MSSLSQVRIRPRFGKLPAAIAYSGRGKNRLYQWAKQHPGLLRKDGASTLFDFDILDRILDGLPAVIPATKGGDAPNAA